MSRKAPKLPKISKKKNEVVQPTNADEYYLEAVNVEESAERWLLSDVKKTLRFYLQAFQMYDQGISMAENGSEVQYNMCYNQTRLLLTVYNEYTANEGINLLQYIDLSDMPAELNIILQSLEQIVIRFEQVLDIFSHEVVTWDLLYNLATCYLDFYQETQNADIPDKFIAIFNELASRVVNELQGFHEESFSEDTVESTDTNTDQYAEVSDQITQETFGEVLLLGYKFIEAVLESGLPSDAINVLYTRLNEIRNGATIEEIDLIIRSIESFNVTDLIQFLDLTSRENIDNKLNEVDILERNTTIDKWTLYTRIGQDLRFSQDALMKQVNDIRTGTVKDEENKQSSIVYKLCEVLIRRSDNELHRFMLSDDEKTKTILRNNATNLLQTAVGMASKTCGFREYVLDKLKRNDIFKHAEARVNTLAGTPIKDFRWEELISEHEFYRSL